jgi:thiamine biosynthesis lipoprotein
MAVDLGGVAKGYAVDKATEALRRNGILQGLINAGGDLYALGRPKEEDFWLIGLQHPLKNKGMAGFIQVEDQAVATSGNYEKYFLIQGKKYTHIIDPRTGWPVKGMASVTVLADSVIKADALATAVFVMGVKEGLKLLNGLPGVEGVLITEEEKNGKEEFSPFLSEGLQGKLKFELP